MCAVLGAIVNGAEGHREFRRIWAASAMRGRDAHGMARIYRDGDTAVYRAPGPAYGALPDTLVAMTEAATLLAACRAEPTTEWVKAPADCDIAPFEGRGWYVVHNGTIANDHALWRDLRLHQTSRVDSAVLPWLLGSEGPGAGVAALAAMTQVVGSYALIAMHVDHPDELVFACNYRPLYIARHLPSGSVYVVSNEQFATGNGAPGEDWKVVAVEPYSYGHIYRNELSGAGGIDLQIYGNKPRTASNKALVVCSGGLDSTVAAAQLDRDGHAVTLLHFDYGCRATKPETRAIDSIAQAMGWPVVVIPLGPLFTRVIGGSPLTALSRVDNPINDERDGEAGAEFAHEWVPARNLIMLSIAVGYAEAHGFPVVGLGINIEEAGAYPDNEHEFIRRLDKLLPYAVGPNKRVQLVAPVANLTKREIVALGQRIGAPMGLTWSCYEDGERHCGRCGPCYMRKTAFTMNGLVDPVFAEATATEAAQRGEGIGVRTRAAT